MIRETVMLLGLWTARPIFVRSFVPSRNHWHASGATTRLLASSAASTLNVENNISRLEKLQRILSRRGAPGSTGCGNKDDLVPVELPPTGQETPELISSMASAVAMDELSDLHPFLYPIARSKSTGNYVCAYRDPFAEQTATPNQQQPWPIVESAVGAPGMRLLALNSEHLMRRIVCECDMEQSDTDLISLYNDGLGQSLLPDNGLDAPYKPGDVEKLGYGVEKYVLLRVGPFPDLYQSMSKQHSAKGDEESSLIAAETANRKMPGFGSTFLSYAKLLRTFPKREEEARDAARMCLRLPLSTTGMSRQDLIDVSVIGLVADAADDQEIAMEKLSAFHRKMKEAEKEDPQHGKTIEQAMLDEVNTVLDHAALEGRRWSLVRPAVIEKLGAAGCTDLAAFIEYLM